MINQDQTAEIYITIFVVNFTIIKDLQLENSAGLDTKITLSLSKMRSSGAENPWGKNETPAYFPL